VTALYVFLIRHGETALNAAGVLRGQLDVPLSDTGEAEASALGELFSGVRLGAIASSPLRRAVDTARPVAASTGAPLEIEDRLRDRFYGEWAGHRFEEVKRRFGSIDAAPGVEAPQLVEARAEAAFLDLVAARDVAVALVTHDAVIQALLSRLLKGVNLATAEFPTGSWSQLVSSPAGTWRALNLGEVPGNGRRPELGARSRAETSMPVESAIADQDRYSCGPGLG
jgi:probable phosphoglycerate mutase